MDRLTEKQVAEIGAALDRYRAPRKIGEQHDLHVLAYRLERPRGRGHPADVIRASRNWRFDANWKPVARLEAERAGGLIARERYLLKLRQELAWLLRLLDRYYVPRRMEKKVNIIRFLRPLGWTEDFLDRLARHLSERRRSKRPRKLTALHLASIWIYEIAPPRLGRGPSWPGNRRKLDRSGTLLEKAKRYVDDLEKRTQRARLFAS
jgi:hypothetical protein